MRSEEAQSKMLVCQ